MHQNAPLPDKKSKKISGEGHGPLPKPLPLGRGYPLPRPYPLGAFGASIGVPVPFHLQLEHCCLSLKNLFGYATLGRLEVDSAVEGDVGHGDR